MFILEGLIFFLLIVILLSLTFKKSVDPKFYFLLWSSLVLLIIIHLFIQGTRWQLYTLYFSSLFLGLLTYLVIIKQISLKNYIRRTLLVVSIVLFTMSLFAVLIFPVYELPVPSGAFPIGTESFTIEDETRSEIYSEDQDDYRKIKIQIWYPAESTEGYEQAPWLEGGQVVTRALSKDFGLPYFILDHTTKIMSNSYFNAPISNEFEDYPVVILSHGWRGFRNLHTDYAEELASLGYIVVAIDHTYGSVATVFEDEVIYLNHEALPERETTPNFLEYANQLVDTYALDVVTTLDYLEELNESNSESRFSGKFDLNHIGLIGHSTGGGGDVVVGLNDDRITSIIGLDAWVEPIDQTGINKGLSIPSLFIRSGSWETGENNENLLLLIDQSAFEPEFYQIDGTTHFDFAMVYMYSPLTNYIGFSGSVEDEYLVSILKSMISTFFDETLKNNSDSQIDPNEWDQVRKINDE